MYTLHVDVKRTRRLTFHHVFDENGQLLYSDKNVGACLRWLEGQGHTAVTVSNGEREWCMEIVAAFDVAEVVDGHRLEP